MSVRAIQSAKRDVDGKLPPVQILPFTPSEQASHDRVPTPSEQYARAATEAVQRMTDPVTRVLARAAGLTDAQFETDLAAEILLGY